MTQDFVEDVASKRDASACSQLSDAVQQPASPGLVPMTQDFVEDTASKREASACSQLSDAVQQ
eukprot:CAMPEP_0117529164 /NCGR_PEP_ID=MMETSP0784-20121206/37693_1 /TAXON_ID=39447 /ORGANISM="" /LENGTH=62 /DNA_ID=CAMNT_0005325481 /DNA_START=27 /DNA_END=212 /DNA_ORIENTATION=-